MSAEILQISKQKLLEEFLRNFWRIALDKFLKDLRKWFSVILWKHLSEKTFGWNPRKNLSRNPVGPSCRNPGRNSDRHLRNNFQKSWINTWTTSEDTLEVNPEKLVILSYKFIISYHLWNNIILFIKTIDESCKKVKVFRKKKTIILLLNFRSYVSFQWTIP